MTENIFENGGEFWGCIGDEEMDYDLTPIPSPPQIVPWDSPDDVPDGIWIRCKHTKVMCFANEFQSEGVKVFGWRSWQELLQHFEYHAERRAKDGWQPCGKVAK